MRQRQWSMVTSTRYVGRSVCWTSPRNLSRSPAQCNQHALRAEYLRCVTGVPARGLIRGEHHWKRHRNRCDPHRRRIPSGLSGLQLRWNDPRQRSSDGDRAGLRIDAIDVPAGGARSRGRGGRQAAWSRSARGRSWAFALCRSSVTGPSGAAMHKDRSSTARFAPTIRPRMKSTIVHLRRSQQGFDSRSPSQPDVCSRQTAPR